MRSLDPALSTPGGVVNRTHRIVRARAQALQARRSEMRSLVVPLLLCAALTLMVLAALWMLLDQYDLAASELPDATHHFVMMLLWFVPVSGTLIAMVWSRRGRNSGGGTR
jgi:cytochrome bd-type quinol oxidase subunit 2